MFFFSYYSTFQSNSKPESVIVTVTSSFSESITLVNATAFQSPEVASYRQICSKSCAVAKLRPASPIYFTVFTVLENISASVQKETELNPSYPASGVTVLTTSAATNPKSLA